MIASASAFAKEYHKGFFEDFNREFMVILAISMMAHFVCILILLSLPISPDKTQQDIQVIQKRFAQLILQDQEEFERQIDEARRRNLAVIPETNTAERTSEQASATGAESSSSAQRAGASQNTSPGRGEGIGGGESSERRRRTRDYIASSVKHMEILGYYSSRQSSDAKAEVDALLGGETSQDDFDEVLENVSGLRSKAAAGGGGSETAGGGEAVRGDRTTEGGDIAGQVTDLGDAVASDRVTRVGSLIVEPVTLMAIEGEKVKFSGRDPDDVSVAVNVHNRSIENCYKRELKRDPNLRGKLVVRFTIAPQGKVEDAVILSSTLYNESVEKCVIRRIKRWDNFGVIDASYGNSTFRQVYTFGF